MEYGARHPRGRADWPKVGIFAQRAKDRPNRLGFTTCRLLGVSGLTLAVAGLDAIDGTPVLDIKPSMHGFLPRGPMTEPEWATELMTGYLGRPGFRGRLNRPGRWRNCVPGPGLSSVDGPSLPAQSSCGAAFPVYEGV